MHWNVRCVTAWSLLSVALIGLMGCAETQRARTVGQSGFLGDLYSQMHVGEKEKALRVYRNPKLDAPDTFARYRKIVLAPVVLYASKDSALEHMSLAEQELLAKSAYTQLYEQLSKDYDMVNAPGPETLHIQAAIIDAEKSNTFAEAMSYLPVPVGPPGIKMALVRLKYELTGKPLFTGELTVEGKVSDAQTGDVLGAIVDRRMGERHPLIGLVQRSTYNEWNDVDEAIRYMSERLRYRFCSWRGATDCVEPKA